MLISIAVYLFNTFGQYSAETTAKMEETQIAQFNSQFLKYYGTTGTDSGEIEPVYCTIHDIVGLANLAKQTNFNNGFTQVEPISDGSYYIQIDLQLGVKTYKNIEAYEESELLNLLKENSVVYSQDGSEQIVGTKYFKCAQQPGIGGITKLVNYMKFVEI